MSYSRNAEDSVLDSIDELVDESLSRGDQSGSWRGERYDRCTWCSEAWHYLPITSAMQAMRNGSYAVDEFGQGIVDPAYRYELDQSALRCPGSEWLGPPTSDREWAWAKQRWGRPRSSGTGSIVPTLPRGDIAIWRFNGPFAGWEIALDDTRELDEVYVGLPDAPYVIDRSRSPRTIVRSQTLTATFDLEHPIKQADLDNPAEWILANGHDIMRVTYTSEGTFFEMKPIMFPFRTFRVDGNPQNQFPDWIEFETTYDLPSRHPWAAEGWERQTPPPLPSEPPPVSGGWVRQREGHEPDVVIIDETHVHNDERLRHYVEEAQAFARQLVEESGIPPTTIQAADEAQRRQAVLRRHSQDLAQRARSMATEEQARAIQEAVDTTISSGLRTSGEAGSTG